MAGKPYIDDDPFDESPGKRDEDIDTGPLTLPQLQGLARDQIAALRNTAQGICQNCQLAFVEMLLKQIECQLCR